MLVLRLILRIFWTWRVRTSCQLAGTELRVNGTSRVTGKTVLGRNVNFNGMRVLGQGAVKFGDNFHSGKGCRIYTSMHNYNGTHLPYDSTVVNSDVTIGKNVWFGDGVCILGQVTIGDGAIIQTNSVVVNDIPAMSIAGGHPARVFAQRDKEHYNRLDQAQAYH